ncbi:hypothetical protein AgCh_030189 [Apium graveolens]
MAGTEFQEEVLGDKLFGGIETCPELVHLPAANDSSLNLLFEKFIEDFNTNIRGIFSPKKYLAHWAHEEHDLKLITIDELYERKHDGEVPLLCEGCVEPIQTDEGKMLLAYKGSEPVKLFQCDGCEVLCNESIRKTRTYKHRWDPHPLDLIYDAGMVEEHEHEFDFLPENANLETVKAVYQDGVLTVTVDKLPPLEPKKPKIIEMNPLSVACF